MITLDQLAASFPSTKRAVLKEYVEPLNKCFQRFHINTPFRIRAFLAQVGHESAEFNARVENLNYSETALRKIFGKYFNPVQAKKYARKPELIASRVYANRMGNRNEASGDGWRFRGRGLIQITGHNNYAALADFLEMSIIDCVKYLETSEGAVISAGWFWASRNLNHLADMQAMKTITKLINGGFNGLEHRMAIYSRTKSIIR